MRCRKQIRNSDYLVLQAYRCVVSDLTNAANLRGTSIDALKDALSCTLKTGDAAPLRKAVDGLTLDYGTINPYTFKVIYQLKSFFKRYIFKNDIYQSTDLEVATIDKFLKVQEHIGRRHELKLSTKLVLQRARKIVKSVLGPFDWSEWRESGKLGVNSCVGFPYQQAYLFNKVEGPITGSIRQLELLNKWFGDYDNVIHAWHFEKDVSHVDALDFSQVPKSFKINRGMMPNTLAGTCITSAIGDMIARRLCAKVYDEIQPLDLDLSRTPGRHYYLAKKASKDRIKVTTDLQSASDCFISELVNRLVPRDWYRILKDSRIPYCNIKRKGFKGNKKTRYSLQSFMTMGIGFTFPLQTLLYYAIIKAIQELHGSYGRISVFGDDLIYPRRIHGAVVSVLTDCGFLVNEEKTFVDEFFRESCGGDFYHGIDVRPYMPDMASTDLGKWDRASLLHKLANGLMFRWSEEELPITALWLKKELCGIGPLMHVPVDFPDYAGLKYMSHDFYLPSQASEWNNNYQCYSFFCLLMSPRQIAVPSLIGYYWDTMRQRHNESLFGQEDSIVKGIFPLQIPKDIYGSARETLKYEMNPVAQKRFLGVKPRRYKCNRTQRRQLVWVPVVPSRSSAPFFRVQQAITILAS